MTAEEIVRKLTKAQREALLKHAGATRPQASFGNMGAEIALMIDGLVSINRSGALVLTDLGLSVRRLLENTHD